MNEIFSSAEHEQATSTGHFCSNINEKRKYYRSSNCLCAKCNHIQQLKIEKISQFKPKNEENFDIEMKIYKEILEQIYDLCEKCKPKVKFEITKQDGILKQYLFRLGEFSFLFEKDSYNMSKSEQIGDNTDTTRSRRRNKNILNAFFFYFMNLCIFLLVTLIIQMNQHDKIKRMSNEKRFNQTSSTRNTSDSYKKKALELFNLYYFTAFSHFQQKAQLLLLYFDTFLETYAGKSLLNSIKSDSNYILLLLLVSYLIACICVSRSLNRNKLTTKMVCLVWLFHLFFICSNYDACQKQFKLLSKSVRTDAIRDSPVEKMYIDLKYDFLGFLIQLLVILIITVSASNFTIMSFKKIGQNKRNMSEQMENQTKSNRMCSEQYLSNQSLKNKPKINLKPSLLNIPIGFEFQKNKNYHNKSPSSAITSNYFLKSKSTFLIGKQSTQNYLDTDYHSDDENFDTESSSSSLISGITNLYLTRNRTVIKRKPDQTNNKQTNSRTESQSWPNGHYGSQSNMINLNNKIIYCIFIISIITNSVFGCFFLINWLRISSQYISPTL